MAFVALRQMRIGGSVRAPGELVPEAAGWKNLRAYLGSHVKEISEAEADKIRDAVKPKAKAVKPKAEVATEPTPVSEPDTAPAVTSEAPATE